MKCTSLAQKHKKRCLKLSFIKMKFIFSLGVISLQIKAAENMGREARGGGGGESGKGEGHKVIIYIEHHSVCPLVGIGTPPPL
jgi:hypothetical protein